MFSSDYQAKADSILAVLEEQNDSLLDSIPSMAKEGLSYSKSIKDYHLQAEFHFYLGYYYHQKGLYPKSYDNLITALQLFERTKNEVKIGLMYRLLGESNRATTNFNLSLDYLDQSIVIFIKHKEYSQLANSYNRKAAVFYEVKIKDSVLNYVNKSNYLVNKYNLSSQILANNYNIMGALYMDYNADSSIMYYKKSLDIIERMNYYGDKSNVLINLSILNYRKQDYSTALQCAKEAHYYSKMNGIIPYIFGSAKLIAFSFAALNMYDSAYSYHKLYADMRDSSHSAQKSQSIINMQKEFEDKKRTQLSDYESTINLYKLLFLSVIGLIAIFVSLFLFKKQKELAKNNVSLQEKNKIIELQKEELSNLNVNKDLLFSIIAHDLRNPVGAMQMIATMLKDNYNDLSQDEKIEFIGYIIVSVQSVNLLLENLLLWSRAQRNIINIHYEDTNPFDLVMIINEIFKPNITNKNLLFENIIPRNLVIKTDENMFMTIMRNIISNAIKFSKSGGTITINYEKLDNKIKFCVTDTGIGMTSEEINNIFKPGKRNPRIGTNDEKGTGLGLLICQDFCKKLNGAIEVNSTLGVGSTFCLMLPAENPIISENQNVTNY